MRFLTILALILLSAPAWAGAWVAPLTGGATSGVYSTTLGTSSVTVLAADNARKFLQIQNITSAGSNILACTTDGTAPVVNGNGIQLSQYGSATFDVYVPSGAVKCIGSAANTAYYVQYTP